jgi:hypothetical protein
VSSRAGGGVETAVVDYGVVHAERVDDDDDDCGGAQQWQRRLPEGWPLLMSNSVILLRSIRQQVLREFLLRPVSIIAVSRACVSVYIYVYEGKSSTQTTYYNYNNVTNKN